MFFIECRQALGIGFCALHGLAPLRVTFINCQAEPIRAAPMVNRNVMMSVANSVDAFDFHQATHPLST